MTEKQKLLDTLIEKSGKTKDEITKVLNEKIDELSGLVSEEGAIYIVANDLGIRLEQEKPKKDAEFVKIEGITEAKVPTSFLCKIIRKYDRVEFSSKSGSEGSVQSALVGDDTGIIRLVFWNDKTELLDNIEEGDILKILNGYSRENTNSERIEVHYGQYSDIEVNPEGVEIKLKEFTPNTDISFKDKKISEIEEGERNIKISATVTDFDIPRFYLGCPECFKKVFQDEGIYKCAQHDEVEAKRIPIVNMIIDDGTETIAIVGFRDRAEELTKEKTNDILSFAENIDKYRNFSKSVIGSKLVIGGNASTNTMTGDKQILVNQVFELELKTVDEVVKELVEEDKKDKDTEKKEEIKKPETKEETKPAEKKEEKKPESKKESLDEDDLDIDIEEIDFDDDLL
jgi:hypothetical protein